VSATAYSPWWAPALAVGAPTLFALLCVVRLVLHETGVWPFRQAEWDGHYDF
jgi:hypothetical protein